MRRLCEWLQLFCCLIVLCWELTASLLLLSLSRVRANREEEEAKKIPYEAEINLCDHLVTYLEHFLVPSNAEAENANTNQGVAELEVDGQVLRAYRRDDDDEVSKKKKGKKSKKQQIAGVKHDKIVHSVGASR